MKKIVKFSSYRYFIDYILFFVLFYGNKNSHHRQAKQANFILDILLDFILLASRNRDPPKFINYLKMNTLSTL